MSKLSETYAQVQNQLQYGPGLAPFFEALVAQIDANTAALAEFAQGVAAGADLIEAETGAEIKDATAREDIGALIDQVAALTEKVKELQTIVGLTTPQEPAPTEPPVAAPSAITPPPSVSTAQPDPGGAAPTSTTGAQ